MALTSEVSHLCSALQDLGIDGMPLEECDQWLLAEMGDNLALFTAALPTPAATGPRASSDAAADTGMDVESDEEADGTHVPIDHDTDGVSLAAHRVRRAAAAWSAAYAALHVDAASEQACEVRTALWDGLAAVCPMAHKAVLMRTHQMVSLYMYRRPAPSMPVEARRAAAVAAAYLQLLTLPGAKAYGLFDPTVLRSCVLLSKRLLEICATAGATDFCVKHHAGQRAALAEARGTPTRRRASNPSHAAHADGSEDEDVSMADAHADAADADSDADFDSDVEESARAGRARPRRAGTYYGSGAAARGGSRKAEEGSGARAAAGSHWTLLGADVAAVHALLASLGDCVSIISLAMHTDVLSAASDTALVVCTLPEHVVKPPPGFAQLALMPCAVRVVLGLMKSHHGAPLTSARIICKKMKPLLLQGAPPKSLISVVFGRHDAEGPEEEAALATDGERPALRRKAAATPTALVEPKVVRSRAVHMVRCIIVDSATGVMPANAAIAIEADVLNRLPAVTALLQHLCMAAVQTKADVRAHATEVIAQLRAALPHSLRRALVRFIVRFGRSPRMAHRLLGIELVGRLLGISPSGAASIMDVGGAISGSGVAGRTVGAMKASALDILAEEAAVPSALEAEQESAGYDAECVGYAAGSGDAAVELSGGAATPVAGVSGTSGDGPSTPSRPRGRATSITTMGLDSAATPARTGMMSRMGGGTTPARTPGSAKSPFYRTAAAGGVRIADPGAARAASRRSLGGGSAMSAQSPATTVAYDTEASGCSDPRPTFVILCEHLLHRASDKSPAVRAKALTLLAALLDVDAHPLARPAAALLTFLCSHAGMTLANIVAVQAGSGSGSDITIADVTLQVATSGTSDGSVQPWTPDSDALALPADVVVRRTARACPLIPLLTRRLGDDTKPAVARAAVSVLQNAARACDGGFSVSSKTLEAAAAAAVLDEGASTPTYDTLVAAHSGVWRAAQVLTSARTRDVMQPMQTSPTTTLGLYALQTLAAAATSKSLLVRKAALSAMNELYGTEPRCAALARLWLAVVLPLVNDPEATVVAKAVECVHVRIIEPIAEWAHAASSEGAAAALLAWELVAVIGSHSSLASCFARMLALMKRTVMHAGASSSSSASTSASVDATSAGAGAGSVLAFPVQDVLQACFNVLSTAYPELHTVATTASSNSAAVCLPAHLAARGGWFLLESVATQFADAEGSASMSKAASRALVAALEFAVNAWPHVRAALDAAAAATLSASTSSQRSSTSSSSGGGMNETTTSLQINLDTTAGQLVDTSCMTEATPSAGASTTSVQALDDATKCLRVVGALCAVHGSSLRRQTARQCASSVHALITAHVTECNLIAAAVKVAAQLNTLAGEDDAWAARLLTPCEAALRRFVAQCAAPAPGDGFSLSAPTARSASTAGAALFLVGELALVGISANSGQGVSDTAAASRAHTAGGTSTLSLAPVNIPAPVFALVQALLVAPRATDEAAGRESSEATATVRAHAYLCLGKLCLRDAALAKKYVSVFVRDLSPLCAPPAVRNNILFVLGDLTVRYTALVDQHVPIIAACCADPHPLVRRHAIILLAQLVVEEFVKFRGPLLYRFAAALADADAAVRKVAESAVRDIIATKARNTIVAHFVGLMFVLTGCAAQPAYAHLMSGVALAGEVAAETGSGQPAHAVVAALDASMPSALRRAHVYRALLAALPEDQALALYGKVTTEVLAAVADGTLRLQTETKAATTTARMLSFGAKSPSAPSTPAAGRAGMGEGGVGFALGSSEMLLADALAFLSSKEVRAAITGGAAGGRIAARAALTEDDEDVVAMVATSGADGMDAAGDGGASAVAAAKRSMMHRIVRRQVAETVLPIVLGLRAVLLQHKSHLMSSLLHYLAVLFEDFPAEMNDALASQRTLAAELEFDIRMWREQQRDPAAAAAALCVRTPIAAAHAWTTPALGGMPAPAVAAAGAGVHVAASAAVAAPAATAAPSVLSTPPKKGSHAAAGAAAAAVAASARVQATPLSVARIARGLASVSRAPRTLFMSPMKKSAGAKTGAVEADDASLSPPVILMRSPEQAAAGSASGDENKEPEWNVSAQALLLHDGSSAATETAGAACASSSTLPQDALAVEERSAGLKRQRRSRGAAGHVGSKRSSLGA